MKKELETLIAELHKEVDAKIDKLIKPDFEVGKWYKISLMSAHNSDEHVPALVCFQGDNKDHYGFSYSGNWTNTFGTRKDSGILGIATLATPTEVQQALEKEAVKRGFVANIKVKDKGLCLSNKDYFISPTPKYQFASCNNRFWVKSKDGYSICIFDKGIWATPIKTMTIDELEHGLRAAYPYGYNKYLTENKTQIIETLNSI